MALWRFGRGWSEATMCAYLAELQGRRVSFDVPLEAMTRENGWFVEAFANRVGVEAPGPPVPHGLYTRARQSLINYDFSDPRIAVGHFDPRAPFVGRDILLEIKVLGVRFLSGCRVHSVRDESDGRRSIFGFRYDTLEGHIERGCEWFLLVKDHASGVVTFRIEARWQLGDFPNWWSRLGFRLIGERYRHIWRLHALERLRRLAYQPVEKATAEPGELAHRGDIRPQRTRPQPSALVRRARPAPAHSLRVRPVSSRPMAPGSGGASSEER